MFARLPQRRFHLALLCLATIGVLLVTREAVRRFHEFQKFYRFQEYFAQVETLKRGMSILESSGSQLENRTANLKRDLLLGRNRRRSEDGSRLAVH